MIRCQLQLNRLLAIVQIEREVETRQRMYPLRRGIYSRVLNDGKVRQGVSLCGVCCGAGLVGRLVIETRLGIRLFTSRGVHVCADDDRRYAP